MPRIRGRIQTNIVRIDGQRSVYVPVLKQGGDSNTITIVNGMKAAIKNLVDIPARSKTAVVFDQSVFVKSAIKNLLQRGRHRPGSDRVDDPVVPGQPAGHVRGSPLDSALGAGGFHLAFALGGGSINTMVLAGLALAFSRLIDNSVVVLENIFRHMEMGESPQVAAEKGGKEVSLAVLAATFTTAIVFFPVTLLYGVSRYLFTALALAVVFSLFASYIVAMTVVPLYCAKLYQVTTSEHERAWQADGADPVPAIPIRFPAESLARFQSLVPENA